MRPRRPFPRPRREDAPPRRHDLREVFKGIARVSYPVTEVRGLQLRRITVSPSGVLLPALPYPVRIGWPADNQSGAVRPVYVQATPTVSPVSGCCPMPLHVNILRTL